MVTEKNEEHEEHEEIKGKVLLCGVNPALGSLLLDGFLDSGILGIQEDDMEKAQALIRGENIDIVLIEYLPEGEDLLEFLKIIKNRLHATSRIALSRAEDRSQVIQLLLKGIITGYYEKPGGFDELLTSIHHVLYTRKVLRKKELLELLDTAEILPAFPKVYKDFMAAVENDLSIKDISHIIERDVSIATRVLRIANSDFFRGGTIGSIERACIYLGLDTIKNIVFTVSLAHLKQLNDLQRKSLEQIIYHSVQVNHDFQHVYHEQTHEKISDQFAAVGITHDIGKIIMLQYLPQRFTEIVKYMATNPGFGFYRSEIELGYQGQTHAEIGAYFLDLWNFPETNISTALFHHTPDQTIDSLKKLMDIFCMVNEKTG